MNIAEAFSIAASEEAIAEPELENELVGLIRELLDDVITDEPTVANLMMHAFHAGRVFQADRAFENLTVDVPMNISTMAQFITFLTGRDQ